MQSDLVRMICQVGIFVICAQAIVHFRPKAAYEKYLKLLVSAMMVLQIFSFVGGIFSPKSGEKLAERIEWFTDSLEESVKKAAQNAFFSQEEPDFPIKGENRGGFESSMPSRDYVPEISIQIQGIEPIWVGGME